MAVNGIPVLKPSSNIAMMNAIRDVASPDYQARIPLVDQANIEATAKDILNHRATRNEFMDVLVNRIGMVTVRENSWTNPLAIFKKGFLAEGDTVEELATDLIKAYTYDHDRESMEKMLFGTHRVGAQASFHKVNRQDMYAVTINTMQLERAFLNSQGGLYQFQGQLLNSALTSDQWDEYLLMTQLFAIYHDNGGFFNVQVPDLHTISSSETEAKQALRMMRTYAGKLKFLSRLYNAAGLPVHADPSKLVFITTPEWRAAVDVDALAAAYNIERAEVMGRIVEVQQEDVGIPGFQALVTTEDFFQVYDKVLDSSQQWNPVTLSNNHFLHHHQIISASRFVPAILFSTAATTPTPEQVKPVSASVSAVTVKDKEGATVTGDLVRGEVYDLAATVTTNPAGGNIGVIWGLVGQSDPMTFIRETGVLHVGPNEQGPLKVTAFAADDVSVKSAELSLTILADSGVTLWPRDRDQDGNVDGQTPPPVGP